jgi:hypothetical protein
VVESLLNAQELTPSHPAIRMFLWPATFLALSFLSWVGLVVSGIGPCGGAGVVFFFPLFLFSIATAVSGVVSCCRFFHYLRHRH